jgi:hypothetical protein
MQILEVAAQGVRGFSPSARAELPAGYAVLTPPSNEPVALAGLLSALLFPDGRGGEAAFLAPGCELGNAALMFRGNDGATYYLARELGGAAALHRANEESGQWDLLTEEAAELAEYLRSHVGLPPKKHFDQAFTLSAGHFPSQKPKPKASTNVESAAAKLPQFHSASKALDIHAARAKLSELMKELELSREIEQWQFRLDGIITQASEVETRLARGAEIKAALQQAEAEYASAPSADSLKLPKDIRERAKRFSQLVAKRDEALTKLDGERSGEINPRFSSIEPLKRNLRFWVAAGLGAAFLAAGIALQGAARYLTLLDIPAFGFAAMLALRYVDDLQRSERDSRKGERRAAREKKIADDFEAEAQWVKKAMAALKVESPNDIVEALARRSQLGHNVQQLRAQVTSLDNDPEYAAAVAKEEQLRGERAAIEAQMAEKGGYVRDAAEVQRDIDRLNKSIEAAEGAPSKSPSLRTAPSIGAPLSPTLDDPFPALLGLAADVLMVDSTTAGNLIRDRWIQYFTTLTDRRYGGLELDRTGKAHVVASGRRLSARELPGKDLDLLYLSARLALVEQWASRAQLPMVIDDLSPVFNGAKIAAVSRTFKHLGSLTQVLHVSSDPGVLPLADAAVSL